MMPAYVSLERNENNPSLKLAPIYASYSKGYLTDNYTALLKTKIQMSCHSVTKSVLKGNVSPRSLSQNYCPCDSENNHAIASYYPIRILL